MKPFPPIRLIAASLALLLACGSSSAAVGVAASAQISEVQYSIDTGAGATTVPELSTLVRFLSSHITLQQPAFEGDTAIYDHSPDAVTLSHAFQDSGVSTAKFDQIGSLQALAQTQSGLTHSSGLSSSYAAMATVSSFLLPAHATFSLSGLASGALDQPDTGSEHYIGSSTVGIWLYHGVDALGSYHKRLELSQLAGFGEQFSEQFALSYTNLSDQAMTLRLGFEGYAYSGALPVPEPSAYGMLAGGLLLLGAVARRKGSLAW
ncbi:PEP-CTERM sorting domain-containing protein [Oxalobacteraceae bacterium]|nr:PEP-CTERM sorting domain-containing protein [Oxalobacteraceae bacterium]